MKIVPLFPRVQTGTLKSAPFPRGSGASGEALAGDVVELKRAPSRTSNLSRDEAFILLGRTLNQLGRSEERASLDSLHGLGPERAVDLLVRD